MKPESKGLYHQSYEHDACGVGFIVDINGRKSNQMIKDGITILKNLEHRGAVGGDQKTGDGAGMTTQIPHKFFSRVLDFPLPASGEYGVGYLFLPKQKKSLEKARSIVEKTVSSEKGSLLGWREVPVNPECLGEMAKESCPSIWQIFVTFDQLRGRDLERKLFVLRKCIENNARKQKWHMNDFYITSLSSQIIIYKGMFVSSQFELFYPDLTQKDFTSAIAMVHQRYSTNTFPSWPLAQPFRFLAHNGEINTLKGNINKISARESSMKSQILGADIKKVIPVIDTSASDSAIMDNVLELLIHSGRSLEHALMMMVPEAFGSGYHISQDKRAFFEYHAAIMDPWDGPAAITFTDGLKIGACMDRNGLRPARYIITKSGKVILASESGVLDINPEDVREKGKLSPGKMIVIDTELKRFIRNNEIKSKVSRWKPYRRWLDDNRIELKGLFQVPVSKIPESSALNFYQTAFGYTEEEIQTIITPMVINSQEPIGSMGNDAAPAVLSEKPQLLFNYFKQIFAQVTNPPIDPYRENLVMSLMSFIGQQANMLEESPQHSRQLKLYHPVFTNDDLERLRSVELDGLKVCTVSIHFDRTGHDDALEKGIENLCHTVEQKIQEDSSCIILSDRGINKTRAAIPALLAISAVNQHLVKKGTRHLTAIILESGEVREVNHFAILSAYGVSAINPYLAFETINDLKIRGFLPESMTQQAAIINYITAVKKGLLKIMSKMGISTIRSYRGSQTYETIGLDEEFLEKYFPGTRSRIGGVGIKIIQQETVQRHSAAVKNDGAETNRLDTGGNYAYRKNSEKHAFRPEMIIQMQTAVRNSNYSQFKSYTAEVNNANKNLCTLRGLFSFKQCKPVSLDEVEPAEQIVKRFVTSAMSFGSISKEAHESLAIAMNRLGAQSNSGEGGEAEIRFKPDSPENNANSKVKQVASARFGVNINYLKSASELQIKIAQGAKPGEGGQLPGFKVNETIARVRHSTPGVMLISPPPHHDIYSIEDLAQLIFDLKCANPLARVSVKLVAEEGVGTVAAGVAKAKADMVLISGNDGGTGASPLSSIKYAGSNWEIGLAETQQTLVMNHLRSRIRIQVDGGLKTGRDIIIGGLLGAEEFGFGTTSLVALGCILMRKCHMNTCPVGIATQNEELRKRFRGKPEDVMQYMLFLAQEVREIMAELGFRKFDDLVGHVDVLEVSPAISHFKAKGLDFSKLLFKPTAGKNVMLRCAGLTEFDSRSVLDSVLLKKTGRSIDLKEKVNFRIPIKNYHRTVGAMLSGKIAEKHGSAGLPEDTLRIKFDGSAGQSFGAFLITGVTFELAGDANDYLGKGLSGGKIIVHPPEGSTFLSNKNVISGNVNLFGATAGEVYLSGIVGERFCVRNSGAIAIVEGVGDHGCEYMTGGRVIVLGPTGVNFAAGMSGGIAYVLDENQLFDTHCNLEMVDIEQMRSEEDEKFIKKYIQNHANYTGSKIAVHILENWEDILPYFVKVMPIEYKRALDRIKDKFSKESDSVGMTEEVY